MYIETLCGETVSATLVSTGTKRLDLTLATDRTDAWTKRGYVVPASPIVNMKNAMRSPHAA